MGTDDGDQTGRSAYRDADGREVLDLDARPALEPDLLWIESVTDRLLAGRGADWPEPGPHDAGGPADAQGPRYSARSYVPPVRSAGPTGPGGSDGPDAPPPAERTRPALHLAPPLPVEPVPAGPAQLPQRTGGPWSAPVGYGPLGAAAAPAPEPADSGAATSARDLLRSGSLLAELLGTTDEDPAPVDPPEPRGWVDPLPVPDIPAPRTLPAPRPVDLVAAVPAAAARLPLPAAPLADPSARPRADHREDPLGDPDWRPRDEPPLGPAPWSHLAATPPAPSPVATPVAAVTVTPPGPPPAPYLRTAPPPRRADDRPAAPHVLPTEPLRPTAQTAPVHATTPTPPTSPMPATTSTAPTAPTASTAAPPSPVEVDGPPIPRAATGGGGHPTHDPAHTLPEQRRPAGAQTALRLAFRSGDHELADAVVTLVAEGSRDRERLRTMQMYLDALLAEGATALPGAARLRRLLGD